MIALLLLSEMNLKGILMIYDNKRNDMVSFLQIDVMLMIFIVRLAKNLEGSRAHTEEAGISSSGRKTLRNSHDDQT